MSLAYKFRKAEKTIQRLSAADREIAVAICGEIRAAQEALQKASGRLMAQCIRGCEGLCCRNGQFDEIIDFWDFVLILLSCPSERAAIRSCVEKEIPLFTADCVFLAKGTGPCIFPPNTRPEVCIVTFCADASAIQKEITRVKCKFIKLGWFIRFRKPIGWLRRLDGWRKKGRDPGYLKRST